MQEAQGKPQEQPFEELVPVQYHDFRNMFSKEAFSKLPPQKPWDHAIDLAPDCYESFLLRPTPVHNSGNQLRIPTLFPTSATGLPPWELHHAFTFVTRHFPSRFFTLYYMIQSLAFETLASFTCYSYQRLILFHLPDLPGIHSDLSVIQSFILFHIPD